PVQTRSVRDQGSGLSSSVTTSVPVLTWLVQGAVLSASWNGDVRGPSVTVKPNRSVAPAGSVTLSTVRVPRASGAAEIERVAAPRPTQFRDTRRAYRYAPG